MPEAFTYFDMARRLKAAFPSLEKLTLCVFEQNGCYAGIGDATAALRRKPKLKAREEDRSQFQPNVEMSFPGLENLTLKLRNGRQISLSGDQIQSRGKALGHGKADPAKNMWRISPFSLRDRFILYDLFTYTIKHPNLFLFRILSSSARRALSVDTNIPYMRYQKTDSRVRDTFFRNFILPTCTLVVRKKCTSFSLPTSHLLLRMSHLFPTSHHLPLP